MARGIKQGLDYFPLDVQIEDKVKLIEAKFGLEGFALLVKMYQKIYSNGYYIEWEEDNALLFSNEVNVNINFINDVINECFDRNIFNKDLYREYNILTSHGIQNRYAKATKRRKKVEMYKEYNLLKEDEINGNIIYVHINPSSCIHDDDINSETDNNNDNNNPKKENDNSQSKVKESKVKESKVISTSTSARTREEENNSNDDTSNNIKIRNWLHNYWGKNEVTEKRIQELVDFAKEVDLDLVKIAIIKSQGARDPFTYCCGSYNNEGKLEKGILNKCIKKDITSADELEENSGGGSSGTDESNRSSSKNSRNTKKYTNY